MFGREFMIRTDNRPLKETPYILHSVGMNELYSGIDTYLSALLRRQERWH